MIFKKEQDFFGLRKTTIRPKLAFPISIRL